MEPQNEAQTPQMPPQQDQKEEKGVGGIIGIIIIVIILIVAGIYLFANHTPIQTTPPVVVPETSDAQGSSDDVSDIDADLQSTNLNNLDGEMADIQAEVDASVQ